jgi:hypothetical protein
MVDMHMANTLKTAVACALAGAVTFWAGISGAHAQPEYDEKLARAMAEKAAERLSGLRDGFSATEKPVFVRGADKSGHRIEETLDIEGMERLAPQIDDTVTGSAFLIDRNPRRNVRIVYAG